MKSYFIIKRAVKRWLLRTLEPCHQMVPLMSESMERRLTLAEFVKLRLHLLVCAWCARYLKQTKFLRSVLRKRATATNQLRPSLATDARDRIAQALQNGDR